MVNCGGRSQLAKNGEKLKIGTSKLRRKIDFGPAGADGPDAAKKFFLQAVFSESEKYRFETEIQVSKMSDFTAIRVSIISIGLAASAQLSFGQAATLVPGPCDNPRLSHNVSKMRNTQKTRISACLGLVHRLPMATNVGERYVDVPGPRRTYIADAQALKWLMSTPEPSGRFGRWAIKIQCGAFKIIYQKGRLNQVADALSRAPLSAEDTPADDHVEEKEVTQYWPNWDGNKSPLSPIEKIGDLVWRKTHILSDKDNNITKGLAIKRDGPWEITKIHGGGAYELTKIGNRKIEKSINMQDLLPYIPSYPIEEWEENQLVGTNTEHPNPNWMSEKNNIQKDIIIPSQPEIQVEQTNSSNPDVKTQGRHHKKHLKREAKRNGTYVPPVKPPDRRPRTRKPNRKYIDGFVTKVDLNN
uniref:Reverse transcriptase RNase H-like domain-containing protein n=1 Tax=Strigamia maritima TaxID=126957 RepID=T1IJP0_STRMM